MKRLHVNTKDATHDELIRLARKCGFIVVSGKHHDKIRTVDGEFITTIPRHNTLKRELVKGIIEAFITHDADITFS